MLGLSNNQSKKTERIDMNRIRIFYDYQIMLAQKYGGISR